MIAQDAKPPLDELAHYGIKGMKWGVRRGGLGSRFRGALGDLNNNRTAVSTRVLEGRSKHLDEKVAGAITTAIFLGRKRRDKAIRANLVELEKQKKRIEKGKLRVTDYLDGIQNVSILDLMVSRRDNRG